MKNTLKVLPWIIILILLAYINQCTTTGTKQPEVIYKDSITYRDSITPPIHVTGPTLYTPVPYEVIVYDTLSQDTTTNEHLSYLDWMAIKKFNLPINDTNQNLNINLEIQYNTIKNWSYSGTVYERYKIKEILKIEKSPQKNTLLVGGMISANSKQYFSVVPSLALMTKKKTLILAGYDIINKAPSVGILVKIGK
jgi:hypothetical protein